MLGRAIRELTEVIGCTLADLAAELHTEERYFVAWEEKYRSRPLPFPIREGLRFVASDHGFIWDPEENKWRRPRRKPFPAESKAPEPAPEVQRT